MKLILLQDVKGQGKKGELIEVSDGYGRNFLLPKNLAKKADNQGVSELHSKDKAEKFKKATEIENAKSLKAKLEELTLKISAKAGQGGKLFGTVTSKEIAAELLSSYKIDLDKRKIHLDEPIKTIGAHIVKIKLYPEINATLTINIIAE